MIAIMHDLKPFFEDNYRRIGVREYAKVRRISPPTASTRLRQLHKEQLLKREVERRHHLYYAAPSELFKDLARAYWRQQLAPLLDNLEEATVTPVIVLFGSLAKGEARKDSDIDLALFTPSRPPSIERFRGRTVQAHAFRSLDEVPERLRQNILNGHRLRGSW